MSHAIPIHHTGGRGVRRRRRLRRRRPRHRAGLAGRAGPPRHARGLRKRLRRPRAGRPAGVEPARLAVHDPPDAHGLRRHPRRARRERLAASSAPVGSSHRTQRSHAKRGGSPPPAPLWARPTGRKDRTLSGAAPAVCEKPARTAKARALPPTAPPPGLLEPSPMKPTKTHLGRALGRPSFSPMCGGVCGHRTGPMALFRCDGCASVGSHFLVGRYAG